MTEMTVVGNIREADALLRKAGLNSAGGPLLVAAAQVRVMIAQAMISRGVSSIRPGESLELIPEAAEAQGVSHPVILWRNEAVPAGAAHHASADPPTGVTIEITRWEWHKSQPWLSGHLDVSFVPVPARPAEPERIDPAIAELLDRAADLLGSAFRPHSQAGDTQWETTSEKWMTDWRAYMHSSYHGRRP